MPVDTTRPNIIELNNVSFAYNTTIDVIRDISLTVHKGDYLGIIGPNGSGKTTLLKIMIGILKPTKGSVKIFGHDMKDLEDRTKIGYVPQKATYLQTEFPATVAEVVIMGRYAKRGILKMINKHDWDIVKKSLEEVDMQDHHNKLIHDLSGGQQQRVLIARALASEPEIIFLDEPTVGIDTQTQQKFYELLEKLNKKMNITLVLVSHDIDVVTNEVSELACINQSLVYHGTPTKFIKDDYLEKLYGKGVKFIVHGH